jgi:hypothetical protein
MYHVTYIYIETKNQINPYTKQEISPIQLQGYININTHIYLAVVDDKKKIGVIDYCRLCLSSSIVNASAWDEFDNLLTDALVLGYKTTLPAYVPGGIRYNNPVKNWDALATLNTFNLDYGTYTTGSYNLFAYRWTMKDLRISLQDNAREFPNLQRCLPVVNGFTCRPFYDKDAEVLWALDGAHYCWYDYTPATPEVQLLDFTELGEIVPCSIRYRGQYVESHDVLVAEPERSSQWILSFPRYKLSEWTPIVVLAGILVLPDEYKVLSTTSIGIDINKYPLHKALVLKEVYQANPYNETGMFYTTKSPANYLRDEFQSSMSPDTYVLFVHTPRLYINREQVDVWRNGLTINLHNPEGILIANSTHLVKNYHREYTSVGKELTIQNTEVIKRGDDLISNTQIGFVLPSCRHENFEDLNRSGCTIIRILGS